MLPEQLLQPRYKVIADYPQPPFNEESDEHKFIEGDIMLYLRVNDHMTYKRIGRCGWMSVGVPCIAHPEKYPKIFRKMEWWEERKIEDMPGYVKKVGYVDSRDNPVKDIVLKIKKHFSSGTGDWRNDTFSVFVPDGTGYLSYSPFLPATEAEYNAYINTK